MALSSLIGGGYPAPDHQVTGDKGLTLQRYGLPMPLTVHGEPKPYKWARSVPLASCSFRPISGVSSVYPLAEDFPFVFDPKSELPGESQGWLVAPPGVQANCAHASLAEEIHGLRSEGLTEAFPSVTRESSGWAKITSVGLEIIVVLSI